MQFLVAVHELNLAGGVLRFERLGRALKKMGHDLTWTLIGEDKPHAFKSAHEVVPLAQAHARIWDAVIAPGAGFSDANIDAFAQFRAPNFGARFQMILNGPQRRERFLKLNRVFQPDLVVFNNEHWPPGSFRDFKGRQFHYLIGAVDTDLFRPATARGASDGFVIGAQAAKSPGAVIAALDLLPDDCMVQVFGVDRSGNVPHIAHARVRFVGPKHDEDLARYYHELDVMVSVEANAGWANVVAEAMASGVAVVTTRAGALATAHHEHTALIIEDDKPGAIADAVLRLKNDEALRARLEANARAHVERFTWNIYAAGFLALVRGLDVGGHYLHAPDLGLFGKTQISERLDGLDALLKRAGAFQHVLDVGAAEGVVADFFRRMGAGKVDAYEIDAGRVARGRTLFGQAAGFHLEQADLTRDDDLARIAAGAPEAGYDLTLYLGVHLHLGRKNGRLALQKLLALTKTTIAIRAPETVFARDDVSALVESAGFALDYEALPEAGSFAGPLRVFTRTAP